MRQVGTIKSETLDAVKGRLNSLELREIRAGDDQRVLRTVAIEIVDESGRVTYIRCRNVGDTAEFEPGAHGEWFVAISKADGDGWEFQRYFVEELNGHRLSLFCESVEINGTTVG
jgi:hypothetical protein